MACAPCIVAAASSGPLAPMALAATGTYMLVKGKPCKKKKKIIIKKTCKKKRKRKSRRKRKSKRKKKSLKRGRK